MCYNPLNLGDRIVACGQCIDCLIKRSQEWAFRLEQEQKTAKSGVFITLTYDDDNAIWIDSNDQTVTTLDKSDIQKFIKRLRKAQGPLLNKKDFTEKIRYFAVGEYGPSTKRAHYHLIVFNLKKSVIKNLDKYWNKGHILVGDVEPKSIRYVTNYMLLKDKDKLEGQEKPFTLMSKKPILGAKYVISNFTHHYEHKDEKLVSTTKHRRNLYRCYENKIFSESDKAILQEKRRKNYENFITEEEIRLEELDPLDPIGAQKQENKEKTDAIKRKSKKRTL